VKNSIIIAVKSKFFVLLFIGLGLTSACQNKFETTSSGIDYRFVSQNPKGQKPAIGDILSISLRYTNENDSVIFSGPFEVQLNEPAYRGAIDEALAMMKTGDSAVFKLYLVPFFKFSLKQEVPFSHKSNSKLVFYIKLNSILTKQEFEEKNSAYQSEKEKLENDLLEDYLQREGITAQPTKNGLYIMVEKEGKGDYPKPGQMVKVDYEGKLIDGRVFDSSYKRKEPFEFAFGNGTVIPGWDEALATMKPGGKVTVIIPSKMAYGSEGAKPVIPPFATLVFQIELLSIK
jgi:FKBP-type peptidyl-prolyl cis-trans isomerase FkpA